MSRYGQPFIHLHSARFLFYLWFAKGPVDEVHLSANLPTLQLSAFHTTPFGRDPWSGPWTQASHDHYSADPASVRTPTGSHMSIFLRGL
jgi:hypothetical protein